MSSDVPQRREAESSGPSQPRRIARFVVLARIGSGGMGVVYEAWDPKLERRVALKLLPPEQRREDARNRLVREAQALARLAHPNVVGVYDVDVEGEAVWIAMEFVEGGTLRSWLSAAPRNVAEILALVRASGEGLAAAHAAGLVHRDFKPDNVLVGSDGRVRVADFGLVRASDEPSLELEGGGEPAGDQALGTTSRSSQLPLTRVGALVGTPGYMAPEQLRGRPADARADQFSFCVVVWEALYGERPFEGVDLAGLREAIERGRIRTPRREVALPERVRRALARGLSPTPEQRFPDMHALLAELRDEAPRRRFAWLLLVPALLVGAASAWWTKAHDAERCTAGRTAAQALWEPARRTSIAERFASELAGDGDVGFARLDASITSWAQDWQQIYEQTCEARGALSSQHYERRMDCLERGRVQVDAWLEALVDADAELIRELPASLSWLPNVDECLRVEGLETLAPPRPEQREAVARVRDEIARIEALLRVRSAASLGEALADLRERGEATGYPPAIAELRRLDSRVAYHEGDPARASEHMREAHALALASGHDSLALSCAIELITLDRGSNHEQRLALGTRWHAQASALSQRLGHPPQAEVELRLAHAELLGEDARFDDALLELDAAATLALQIHGPDSLGVLAVERRRVSTLQQSGRYAEALDGIDRVLAGEEALLGPHHPQLLFAIGTRVNIATGEGRYEDALRDAMRAVEIAERSYGPTHSRTLRNFDGVAVLYSLLGDHVRARETFEDLITRIGERERAVSSTGTNATMGLCATLLELEDVAAAREVCPRASEAVARLYGDKSPVGAVARNNLALLARLEGDARRSLALEHEALVICQATLGPLHGYVTYAHVGIAESLLMLGRPHEAYAAARMAVALRAATQDRGELGEALCLLARAAGDRELGREALGELEAAGNKQRQAKTCAAWLSG